MYMKRKGGWLDRWWRFSKTPCLLLAGCALLTCGSRDDGEKPVRLGLVTESQAVIGSLPVVIGEQRVRELNSRGGVLVAGKMHPVQLFIEDSQNTPEGSAQAALRLINTHQVVALIGPNQSTNALPVAQVAQQAKVVMISAGATHPDLTLGRPYVFRLPFTDRAQARAMARFARQELKMDEIAVLYDAASNYSRAITSELQASFESQGGRIVASEGFTAVDGDLQPVLERLRDLAPQGIFLPSTEFSRHAQRLREMGSEAVFLGSDIWGSRLPTSDPALAGSYATASWHSDLIHRYPEAEAFSIWFRDLYGDLAFEGSSGLAYLAADAFNVLVQAIEDADSLEPPAIRDALAEMEGFPGAMGPLTFRGTSGDPERPVLIVRFARGEVELVELVEP